MLRLFQESDTSCCDLLLFNFPRILQRGALPSVLCSSVVGYDDGQQIGNQECPVGRQKLGRKAEQPSKRRILWPRWTGFGDKTIWDWLQLLVVPLMLLALGFWFTTQQDAR